MSSALELLRLETDAQVERIRTLTDAVAAQSLDLLRAEERHRALCAQRSTCLLQHLRQHAEEEAQKRALEATRKGAAAAWERITELQRQNASIVSQSAQQDALDERAQTERKAHEESVTTFAQRATCAARLLEAECHELTARLRVVDDERATCEAQEAAASAAAAEARAAKEAHEQRETHEAEATHAAAAADVDAPAARRRVESAVLSCLAAKGNADATTILRSLRDAGGDTAASLDAACVHHALQCLKESWAVYEVAPGSFRRL
jgi:hypothetical protein